MNQEFLDYKSLTEEAAREGCMVLMQPPESYHGSFGVSKSVLDRFNKSPAHLAYGAKREPTRAMTIGTAIHTALLEPHEFESRYCLLRDVKDRRQSEYKEAVKVHGEEYVLVGHEADKVAGMQESVFAQPEAAKMLSMEGNAEVSAYIEDPETGLLIKCRYDLLAGSYQPVMVDLKKTRDASPEEFSKSVYNYRYHVQDAMYSYIFELINGYAPQPMQFVAVEEEPPHCAMVYELDEETRMIGYAEMRRNLNRYAECVAADEWPGYDNPRQTIGLPGWAIAKYENEAEVQL